MTKRALLEILRSSVQRTGRNPWNTLTTIERRGGTGPEEADNARAALNTAYTTLFPNHLGPLKKDERLMVVDRAIRLIAGPK